MDAIRMMWRKLAPDQKGATAIEYGLIVALISIALVGSLSLLGGGTLGMWTGISDQVSNAM